MSWVTAATLASLIAGLAAAVQATLAGILGRRVGVLPATALGAVVGGLLILVVTLAVGKEASGIAAGVREPAWLWVLPGVLGAIVLTTFTFAPPRIGTFATFALLIGGQLVASLLIDSAGLFGVERVPLTATRVGGLILLAAGVLLVLRR
jgi:transporter family-2 protein